MRQLLTSIKLSVLLIFSLSANICYAGNEDSLKAGNKPDKAFQNESGSGKQVEAKQFTDLDNYLQQTVFTNNAEGPDNMEAYAEGINNSDDPSVLELKNKAASTIAELIAKNKFISFLNPFKIQELPIGWRRDDGKGSTFTIAISNATIHPDYTELTIFARFENPKFLTPLFFGIQGIRLSHTGGIIGLNTRMVLLGDAAIPINGNSSTLIFRGGTNIKTGVGDNLTYIGFDCNGFKELVVTADVELSRNIAVPVDNNGVQLSGRLKAHLGKISITGGLDDLIVDDLGFDHSFEVPKFAPGFIFTVNGLVLDLSDTKKSSKTTYPTGYQQKYLQANMLETWKGFYAQDITVKMPSAFKDRKVNNSASFSVHDLIIDNNGISGLFCAENVLKIADGTASGWRFSINSICIGLEANKLVSAGLGGQIMLPVNKYSENDADNSKRLLTYSALISSSGDYVFRVVTTNKIEFDVFRSKVTLQPNSYIKITGNKDRLDAEALLNGTMELKLLSLTDQNKVPEAGEKNAANFEGIEFKGLFISTKAPYFDFKEIKYTAGEVSFGNFPITLSDISLNKNTSVSPTEYSLSLGIKLMLGEDGIVASTNLKVVGKINEEDAGLFNIKYDRCQIEKIAVKNARVNGTFTLNGEINFFDNNKPEDIGTARYGKGFQGYLKANFDALGFDITLRALFAKTPTYRYWYIDGQVDLKNGIPLPTPPLVISGFAGGAYYRMKRAGFDPAFSVNAEETGINYVPDETAGIGIKAQVLFGVSNTEVFKGGASFEIAFNRGGGLRYIGFFGFVKILADLLPQNTVAGAYLRNMQAKGVTFDNKNSTASEKEQLETQKNNDATGAAKKMLTDDNSNEKPGQAESGFSAYIGIQYDFNAKVLHASLDMYISAAGGLLRGSGQNNRAGWAELHIAPGKWHFYVGTPQNPCGIKFGIGSFNISTASYFMLGNDLPPFPDPPKQTLDQLRASGLTYENRINKDNLSGGRGLAFGASANINTGDLTFLFVYANFAAGIGFDVMLAQYNQFCNGKKIGINGWYAKGQAYAYLQGELGIQIKLLFLRKRISIIKGGAAALLQAKLPNPTWVGGALGLNISVLGGLFKAKIGFKISFGNDDCVTTSNNSGPSEADLQVIEEVKPGTSSEQGINPLVHPYLKLQQSVDISFDVPKADGGTESFKTVVDGFKLFKTGSSLEIPSTTNYNLQKDILTLTPNAILESNTDYTLTATVSFKRGAPNYMDYTENGLKVQQVKSYNFKTGNASTELDPALIAKMYPFFNQRNFYPGEPNKGSIKLSGNYASFFQNYANWKVVIKDKNGNAVGSNYATTNGNDEFIFALPANLQTAASYKLQLLGEVPKPGLENVDLTKPALEVPFTTSLYPTLAAKINALQVTESIVGRESSDVINLQASTAPYEGFELYEITGNKYTGDAPMVQGEMDVTDEDYYNNVIRPLIYPTVPFNAPNLGSISITDPLLTVYGLPPFKAVLPSWFYVSASTELSVQQAPGYQYQFQDFSGLLKTRFPFVYNSNKYYNLHFQELRKLLISGYTNNNTNISTLPSNIQDLLNRPFPFMKKGTYKVKFKFVQFDGTSGIPAEFIYTNPID